MKKITKEDFQQGDWVALPFEYHEPEKYLFIEKKTWYTKLIDWVKELFK